MRTLSTAPSIRLAVPLSATSIRIRMFVRSQVASDTTAEATYDPTFASIYWEKFISPKNLRTLK